MPASGSPNTLHLAPPAWSLAPKNSKSKKKNEQTNKIKIIINQSRQTQFARPNGLALVLKKILRLTQLFARVLNVDLVLGRSLDGPWTKKQNKTNIKINKQPKTLRPLDLKKKKHQHKKKKTWKSFGDLLLASSKRSSKTWGPHKCQKQKETEFYSYAVHKRSSNTWGPHGCKKRRFLCKKSLSVRASVKRDLIKRSSVKRDLIKRPSVKRSVKRDLMSFDAWV